MFLAGEPAGFHQREQVSHVIQVVVGEQDTRDGLVADARLLEPVKYAGATVDEEGPTVFLYEIPVWKRSPVAIALPVPRR